MAKLIFHGPESGGQIGMPGNLRELITASFDAAAADGWSKFTVGEAEKLVLHEAALNVLRVLPGRMPGQCALMSALYSLTLENLDSPRGYVVAGSLCIGDKRVFGEEGVRRQRAVFGVEPRLGRARVGRLWRLARRCVGLPHG
jgi:hypothetical protein